MCQPIGGINDISVLIRLGRWLWVDELIEIIPQRRKGAKAQRKEREKRNTN